MDELLYVDCPELIHFSHLSSYTFVQSAPDVILEVAVTYVLTPEEKAQADQRSRKSFRAWSRRPRA